MVMIVIGLATLACGEAVADDAERPELIELAARAGLETLEASAAFYPEQRTCFSCHHQTLPMLAMVEARRAGLAADDDGLLEQRDFTHDAFTGLRDRLLAGHGIGGRAMTVAYGLWALDLAAAEQDATTGAMVGFLLQTQEDDGSFWRNIHRPPLEDSQFRISPRPRPVHLHQRHELGGGGAGGRTA